MQDETRRHPAVVPAPRGLALPSGGGPTDPTVSGTYPVMAAERRSRERTAGSLGQVLQGNSA